MLYEVITVGAVCSHTGKTEQALQAYLQVVALNPSHAGGQEGVGLEYMALQAMDRARPYLMAAVALDSKRWRAHNALGILADRVITSYSIHYTKLYDVMSDCRRMITVAVR